MNINLFMEQVEPVETEEESTGQKKTIFDYINNIFWGKDESLLDENEERGVYNPYMVNSACSQHLDTVLFANEINIRPGTPKFAHHRYFFYGLPRKKRFAKWAKKDTSENHKIELIQAYYGYSIDKAKQAMRVLKEEDYTKIQERLYQGGKGKTKGKKT